MKTTATLILILVTIGLHAQVPGYLGKRFTLFLEANPTPAFLVQNTNNALIFHPGSESFAGKRNPLAFNLRPQVELDYLVHRDFSIGFRGSYVMAGTTRAMDISDESGEFMSVFDPAVIKGQSLGINLKFFRFKKSASIAPIGFYKNISIMVSMANVYGRMSSNEKIHGADVVAPVVAFGLGRQSIIARNILLKTGFELSFTGVQMNFLTEREEDWSAEEFTKYNMHRSLFSYNLFTLNVALGYISF
jgi:hypothetical protein